MEVIMKIKFLMAVLFSTVLNADVVVGKVVKVVDGDTLTILSNNRQYKVRLVEIDAPERSQGFGQKSKQLL